MPEQKVKLSGYRFWNEVLKGPRFIAAPMVEMSELSFRMLCRRYQCQLCYTPMINSHQFLIDHVYRKSVFTTCTQDRPLIAQFCANNPDVFVAAAKLVESHCDAIDLNLGCPQGIAKRGHYGAFLQEDLQLVEELVQRAAKELSIPVSCKVRILPGPIEDTINYAKMLEKAGCSLLTVHGRTREQKGWDTGLASWEAIKTIKESVKIPVVANGNILNYEDIFRCLEFTKADAIMSAEGLLHNPALFSDTNPLVWEIALEYMDLAHEYRASKKHVRAHLFRILRYSLDEIPHLRDQLAQVTGMQEFRFICEEVRGVLQTRMAQNDAEASKTIGEESQTEMPSLVEGATEDERTILETEDSVCCESDWILTGIFGQDIVDIVKEEKEYHKEESAERVVITSPYHMPVWKCHSRPRSSVTVVNEH